MNDIRSLLKDDATLGGILLFSGLRPVAAPRLQLFVEESKAMRRAATVRERHK